MVVAVKRAAFGAESTRVIERAVTPQDIATALAIASEVTGKPESEGRVTISGNTARVFFDGFSPVILLLNRE